MTYKTYDSALIDFLIIVVTAFIVGGATYRWWSPIVTGEPYFPPSVHCAAEILQVEPEWVAASDDWVDHLGATAEDMERIWRECR